MTSSSDSIFQTNNHIMPPSYGQLFDDFKKSSSALSNVELQSSIDFSDQTLLTKDRYPIGFAIFHAVMLGASSICVIVLQIVFIVLNGAHAEVSTGIWCGAIGLFTLVFLIYASRPRLVSSIFDTQI